MTGRDLIKELLDGINRVTTDVMHVHDHLLEHEGRLRKIEELTTQLLIRLEHRISGDARFEVKFGSPRNKRKQN